MGEHQLTPFWAETSAWVRGRQSIARMSIGTTTGGSTTTESLAGYFNETETDEVAWDGNSYTGSNETTLYFLSGAVTIGIDGHGNGDADRAVILI